MKFRSPQRRYGDLSSIAITFASLGQLFEIAHGNVSRFGDRYFHCHSLYH
jgi:hypothetical protein